MVTAKYDFVGADDTQLTFTKGTSIRVLAKTTVAGGRARYTTFSWFLQRETYSILSHSHAYRRRERLRWSLPSTTLWGRTTRS